MNRRRIAIVAGAIVAVVLLYVASLHGECHEAVYPDGSRFTSRQSLFSWTLWATRWSEPAGLPDPSAPGYVGTITTWRGFGLLWRSTRHMEHAP